MIDARPRRRALRHALVLSLALVWLAPGRAEAQVPSRRPVAAAAPTAALPDFAQQRRQQAATDRAWREASRGVMRMEKITYRSRTDGLRIPAFIFSPLASGPAKSAAALVWVHEDIRGHLYEHYIPYIREATRRGYVVIAPEYRGSIGYGQAFFDAIDYGGAEVDDVVTAVGVLTARHADVDPARVGIIGWSHGGLISLLAVSRHPGLFTAAAAIVPVSNLIDRLAQKGEAQRRAIDPHDRFGGPPSARRSVYEARSPLFQVDRMRVPLLVHIAANDDDVSIEEALPLVDALRARKAGLAETKVYRNPLGGHVFDRLVMPRTWQPRDTEDQRDSWSRVWDFFGRHIAPPAN